MSTILFEVNNAHFPGEGEGAFSANTFHYDPWSGQVWASVFRGTGWQWIPQPSPLTLLHSTETFPHSCPGSLIGPHWLDTFLWAELPPPLLRRELTVLEEAMKRLTSGVSIWYNNRLRSTLPWEPTMIPDTEVINRLAQARYKLSQGTLTNEELREALRDLRQHRISAAEVSAKSRKAATPVDGNALLAQFLS